MKYLILVLLMIGFVSAVDIDFDCPDEIFVDEEFECSLEVFDGDGEYDVKIDLDKERDSVLKTWNDGVWKSGYYYLKEFIEDGDEESIRLIVSEDGDWDGVLKLRQGDKREFFDIEMRVSQPSVVDGSDSENLEGSSSKEGSSLGNSDGSSQSDGGLDNGVIVLGNDVVALDNDVVDESGLVYVSKDRKIVNYLPYGFAVFMIFVVGILLIDKR